MSAAKQSADRRQHAELRAESERRRLIREQRDAAIRRRLTADPELSVSEVAGRFGVSVCTVKRLRTEVRKASA